MKKLNYVKYLLFLVVIMFGVISPVFASMEGCDSLDIDIDERIASVVHNIIRILQIVIPVLLVIFGSIDFLKAVVAQKEDEIKKGQQTFIKRAIAAVIVFFVTAIVRLIVSFAAGDDEGILQCANCFLNGPDDCKVETKKGNTNNNSNNSNSSNQSSQSNQKTSN